MLYIISESCDKVTDIVIEWLISKNSCFSRFNNDIQAASLSCNLSNTIESMTIDSKLVDKIWHRRGKLNLIPRNIINDPAINFYLRKEADSIIKSGELLLKKIPYIGGYIKETENYKLTQLEASKSVGLDIPDTLVTNCKSHLLKFYTSHNTIIVKDIRYPVNIKSEKGELTSIGVKIASCKMYYFFSNYLNIFIPN